MIPQLWKILLKQILRKYNQNYLKDFGKRNHHLDAPLHIQDTCPLLLLLMNTQKPVELVQTTYNFKNFSFLYLKSTFSLRIISPGAKSLAATQMCLSLLPDLEIISNGTSSWYCSVQIVSLSFNKRPYKMRFKKR